MRLAGDSTADLGATATKLLDKRDPGRWNQAVMELGATVCLPRDPLCSACPLALACVANRRGIQRDLPPPKKKPSIVRKERTLLVIRRKGRILLTPSPRVSGFWELPEAFSGVRLGPKLGAFRHAITNTRYGFEVREARIATRPRECRWGDEAKLLEIPLSTPTKKALNCLHPPPIAPSIDVQPRAVAKTFALADLNQPDRPLANHVRCSAFGHQHNPAAIGVDLCEHLPDLRHILRRRHHELELILVLRHQLLQHLGLIAKALVLRRPLAALAFQRSRVGQLRTDAHQVAGDGMVDGPRRLDRDMQR